MWPDPLNARIEYGAALLPSGLILIAGGSVSHEVDDAGLDAAELYSPGTKMSTPTKSPLNVPRAALTATALKSGKVLLAGGSDDSGTPLASAEIYDPQTNTFALSQCTMADPRFAHTATLLKDGRVLLVGGFVSLAPGPRSRRRPLSATQPHPTTSLVGISWYGNEP
jgi:Galactose oxidase, central domain